MGPISFGTTALEGHLEAVVVGGALSPDPAPRAELRVDLAALRSGNSVYDAELARRLDVRRYPVTAVTLHSLERIDADDRYLVTGSVGIHGVTRTIEGSVSAVLGDEGRCTVSGEQAFDIRDFGIPTPTVLMLRIFPDVHVHLRVELRPSPAS